MIIPAYITAAHATLVPSFVTWYDRNNNVFTDPSSPVGDFFRMIGKKGWGIRYSYKGNASGKVLNIDFTNDQLKQMETSNNFTGNT